MHLQYRDGGSTTILVIFGIFMYMVLFFCRVISFLHTTTIAHSRRFINSNTCYDDLNITLYCASYPGFFAGYYVILDSTKGGKKMALREAVVMPREPSWDGARWKIIRGSMMELGVELSTSIRASGL